MRGIFLAEQERKRAWGESIFSSGRLPPAILLAGPAGAGKATLALEFARRHVCRHSEAAARPCGACAACRETAYLRYPDFILFSARDLAPACRALRAVADRARLEALAYETELLARRAVQRIRSGFFKLRDVTNKEAEALEERIAALEKLLPTARLEDTHNTTLPAAAPAAEDDLFAFAAEAPPPDAQQQAAAPRAENSREWVSASPEEEEDIRARLTEALRETEEIDALVQRSVLPIAGIQEIIRALSRRPLFGERRVVLIEGLEKLRTEGANAFLKTLEEPPPDTLILLIASDLENVLATIRSRSAILPMARMTDEEIRRVAREYYGLTESAAQATSGARDIYAWLEAQGGEAGNIRDDIARFLDLIQNADRDASFFDFAKDLEKRKMAAAFCYALIDLITENVAARETGVGSDRLYALVLARFRNGFLRKILREARALAAGIQRNNFSASQGITALVQAFWLEKESTQAM